MYQDFNTKVWRKSEKLQGFVKDETIRKYLHKSRKDRGDKTRIEPRTLIYLFFLFCGSIFLYYLYTLLKDYQSKEHSEDHVQ